MAPQKWSARRVGDYDAHAKNYLLLLSGDQVRLVPLCDSLPIVLWPRCDRRLFIEYLDVPHGKKGTWLESKPFTRAQLQRWRRAYLAEESGREVASRRGGGTEELLLRAKEAEEELERARAALLAAIAEKDNQIRLLEEGTETLGKAFGLLQKLASQEPEDQ